MDYTCPVCMYAYLSAPPYNKLGYGSYEICPCCSFQFGYDDYPEKESAYVEWRIKWIDDGCKWFSKNITPPLGWSLKRQLLELEKNVFDVDSTNIKKIISQLKD